MLAWSITDLRGVRLATIIEREDGKVSVALCAKRTAQVSIPMGDAAGQRVSAEGEHGGALSLRLRATYFGVPLFNGTLIEPEYDFTDGRILLSAVDPVNALERFAIGQRGDGLLPSNGASSSLDDSAVMWLLVAHRSLTQAEIDYGIPPVGIEMGTLAPGITRPHAWEKGKPLYGAIHEISELEGGPDYELEPTPERDDYLIARFNTYVPNQGQDRRGAVQLHYGLGKHNASGFVWRPGGGAVSNLWTTQGQAEDGREAPMGASGSLESIVAFGKYGRWESLSDVRDATRLRDHAKAGVSTGAFPVDHFDVIPAVELRDGEVRGYARNRSGRLARTPGSFRAPPRFGPTSKPIPSALGGGEFDYWIGDTIGGLAFYEGLLKEVSGRVTDATFNEQSNGDVAVELTCAPTITAVGAL